MAAGASRGMMGGQGGEACTHRRFARFQDTVHLERPLPVDIDDAVAAITGDTEGVLRLAPFAPSGVEMKQTVQRGALRTRSVSIWEEGRAFHR